VTAIRISSWSRAGTGNLQPKIFLGDGKGHFVPGPSLPSNDGDPKWSTRNAAVGDLNGDGYPDIAVANRGMTSYIGYNDGMLHFKCNSLRDTPSAATILIADMDGNGSNDVIFACRNDCQSRVFFGRNLAGEGRPWGLATASVRAMAVADLNGDGHPDIAACPEGLGCFVYFNDGNGNFSSGIQFQKAQALPYSMISADLL
jgi:hypothetical protein